MMDEYLEYFVYLDELRESGTINMMGAPRELQFEFGIDTNGSSQDFWVVD